MDSASTSSLRPERLIRRLNSGDVDQPDRGVDHDRARARRRELREHRTAGTAGRATTPARATSEYSWLRLPSESPMTVRLPLLLTGNPWISPVDRLDAPRASSSWLASMRVVVAVGEGAGGEHVVGVADDRARRLPGSSSCRRSRGSTSGSPSAGNPAGISPTTASPAPAGRAAHATAVAPSTAMSGPGPRGNQWFVARQDRRARQRRGRSVASCTLVEVRDERAPARR